MAKQTAQTGAIATQQQTQPEVKQERFSDFLSKPKTQAWIASVISDPKEASKFVSSIVSATTTNVQLQQCERNSIISSGLLANTLGLSLSPQLGLCYMVPFKNKAKLDREGHIIVPEHYTATFVLGYKGYIQLAIRSGYYKNINFISIKQGELIKYDPLTEELEVNLILDERERDKLPTIGYYASFKLMNGFTKAIYWSKEKMLVHADRYSAAFSAEAYDKLQAGTIPEKDMWRYSSFWYQDFDGMAYKTMLRQLISKWGIMSIDMQTAEENEVKAEQGRVNTISGMVEPTDISDEPPTPEELSQIYDQDTQS